MKLMNRRTFSFLFFSVTTLCLIFGFNNCGSGDEGTVVSESQYPTECIKYVNRKVSSASLDNPDEFSPLLTPVDGNWEDPSRDPRRSDQTYLDILAADQAHQIIYEDISPSLDPVIVAVIDDGIDYNHVDLSGQMYRRNDGTIVGYDYYNGDGNPIYENKNGRPMSHGTHVAGLIAAEGHNDEGIRGGAPEFVKIMPIKIFGPGGARNIHQAIRYAVDQGADVINMSFGMTSLQSSLTPGHRQKILDYKAVLEYALNEGVISVIAAGNDDIEINDTVMAYPANFGSEMDGVITVGAYDTIDETMSPFSNYSPVYVEVQAPGSKNRGGILSTMAGNTYGTMAGTSMATPLVAGLVALAKVYLKKKGINLIPSQIEDLVKESSIKRNNMRSLAQEGRVINYKNMADSLVKVYESGIIEHPKNLRLEQGQTGRLSIRVSDYSSVSKFQWYHNGEIIDGANEIEFMVRDITPRDEGEYYVELTLESGDVVTSLKGRVKIVEEGPCD